MKIIDFRDFRTRFRSWGEPKTSVLIGFIDTFSFEFSEIEVTVKPEGGYVRFNHKNGPQAFELLYTHGKRLIFRQKVEGDNFVMFIKKQWKMRRKKELASIRSAAPELLLACSYVRDYISSIDGDLFEGEEESLNFCKHAIDKAMGRLK